MKPPAIIRTMFKDFKLVPKNLRILTLAFFAYYISWGIIFPFMPLYFKSIAISYSLVGLIIATHHFLGTIISIPVGELVDKIGRKSILIFSFLNYNLLGPLYANAQSVGTLIIARLYNACTASGVWIPGITLARDFSPKNKEAESIGFFNFGYNLAVVVGALISIPLIFFLPLNYLFYSLAITGTLAAILIYKKMPETIKKRTRVKVGIREIFTKDKIIIKGLKDLFSGAPQRIISALHFINSFNYGIILMVLALFVKEIGAELWQIGLIYFIFYIPFTTQFRFGLWGDRIGRKKIFYIGSIVSSLAFLLLFLSNNIWMVFLLALCVSVGTSAMLPIIGAYITDLSRGKVGEITGSFHALSSLGIAIGPFVAGIVSDLYGLNYSFLLSGIVTIFGLIIFSFYKK